MNCVPTTLPHKAPSGATAHRRMSGQNSFCPPLDECRDTIHCVHMPATAVVGDHHGLGETDLHVTSGRQSSETWRPGVDGTKRRSHGPRRGPHRRAASGPLRGPRRIGGGLTPGLGLSEAIDPGFRPGRHLRWRVGLRPRRESTKLRQVRRLIGGGDSPRKPEPPPFPQKAPSGATAHRRGRQPP